MSFFPLNIHFLFPTNNCFLFFWFQFCFKSLRLTWETGFPLELSMPCVPETAWLASTWGLCHLFREYKSLNYLGRNFSPRQMCLSESSWIACTEASTKRMFHLKFMASWQPKYAYDSQDAIACQQPQSLMGTGWASAYWYFLVEVWQSVPFLNLCSFWIINFRMGNHS